MSISENNEILGRSDSSKKVKAPLLAKITIVALLLPISFDVGTLVLSPSRILFLIVVPFMGLKWIRGQYCGFTAIDGLLLFNVFWFSIAIFVNNPSVAVQFVGSTGLTIFGGYLIGRASIRTKDDFIAIYRFMVMVIILCFPLIVVEALTHRNILIEVLDALPIVNVPPVATEEKRLGLYRVQFLFVHPIHFGFFCSLLVSISYFCFFRPKRNGFRNTSFVLCAVACFLSLSSGAVLAMAVQFFFILWRRATATIAHRWRTLFFLSVTLYLVVELVSDRPAIIAIVSRLALNSSTVEIRQRLFEFGSVQIGKTPIFGVGYNDWGLPPWMSGSIDNFWLLQAILYGLPAMVSLMLVILVAISKIGKKDFADSEGLEMVRAGWAIMIVSMSLTLSTVAVWGNMQALIMFFIASGMWMLFKKTKENSI